jgi:hypothetical protein
MENKIKTEAMPMFCPKCKQIMKKRLDKKMWPIHNMCFDCVIKMEGELKRTGKYKEYEQNKIEANMKAYLKDSKQKASEYLEALNQVEFLQNSMGDIEKWDVSQDQIDEIKNQYNRHLEDVQNYLDKIGE